MWQHTCGCYSATGVIMNTRPSDLPKALRHPDPVCGVYVLLDDRTGFHMTNSAHGTYILASWVVHILLCSRAPSRRRCRQLLPSSALLAIPCMVGRRDLYPTDLFLLYGSAYWVDPDTATMCPGPLGFFMLPWSWLTVLYWRLWYKVIQMAHFLKHPLTALQQHSTSNPNAFLQVYRSCSLRSLDHPSRGC